MITIGIISAFGLLLLAFKIMGRKVIGLDVFFDIGITVALMIMFAGTFSGMAAAMIGGLSVSVVLLIMRKTMTHEVLKIKKGKPSWHKVKP